MIIKQVARAVVVSVLRNLNLKISKGEGRRYRESGTEQLEEIADHQDRP